MGIGEKTLRVSASLLSCDTAYLGETVIQLEKAGVDSIHLDIMDGHYVENFAFSPKTVQDLSRLTSLPLEVHLEIYHPERYIATFAEAGADLMIVQLDTCKHPIRILDTIHEYGKKAGVAINPTDGLERVKYFVEHIDYLLLMSVEPGFGGQRFEESVIKKVRLAKALLEECGNVVPIGMDGGVSFENIALIKKAGVEVAVVGTALFSQESLFEAVARFKN